MSSVSESAVESVTERRGREKSDLGRGQLTPFQTVWSGGCSQLVLGQGAGEGGEGLVVRVEVARVEVVRVEVARHLAVR